MLDDNGGYREEYFAQWDVIILSPELVHDISLSLEKIRKVNPSIKILVWIPFGLVADKLMNPWENNYAWPKYIASFVEDNYLRSGMYDGVMFDCIWERAPTWSSPKGKLHVSDDEYNEGVQFLFRTLRSDRPNAIITGNGIWKGGSPYYRNTNGNMAENAFGNEFRSNSEWPTQWAEYVGAISSVKSRDLYYFMSCDLQFDRNLAESSMAEYMTPNDERRFRLGLTTTLLGDGYFGFDRGDMLHGQLWWFAEYNVDLGMPLSGYEAPHSYRTNVYHTGTYSREFTNGSVIVNPSASAVSILFSENHVDASTGTVSSAFVIPASDGRIFMKSQP